MPYNAIPSVSATITAIADKILGMSSVTLPTNLLKPILIVLTKTTMTGSPHRAILGLNLPSPHGPVCHSGTICGNLFQVHPITPAIPTATKFATKYAVRLDVSGTNSVAVWLILNVCFNFLPSASKLHSPQNPSLPHISALAAQTIPGTLRCRSVPRLLWVYS